MPDLLAGSRSPDSGAEALAEALKAEIHSFHFFELFVGIFATLVAAGVAIWLYREHLQRKDLRQERETALTLSRELDVKTLKRVLGGANFPSWMQFPDRERVGWINDLLTQLWPHAATAAASKVRESLEPALAANKPRWMTDIALHTFTLGDAAPYVAAIKVPAAMTGSCMQLRQLVVLFSGRRDPMALQVYKTTEAMEEAIAEVDLVWAGKAKFQLLIKPLPKIPIAMGLDRLLSNFISMRAGVSDLYFSGRVRFALSPLVNHVPVVGALKVSLVSQPEFSYNLSVQGGDITFLPGLEAFINSFVRETVLQPYILPEGFRLPLDAGGVLEVRLSVLKLT
ncbi:hypothetical protein MMC29_003824 [Sticta canariensis]|nr:hypothetical protein [Sticta canariensis]